MIVSFRSRALKRYWERSETRRVPAEYAVRIGMILDRLDTATEPRQMNATGLRFHALTGNLKGRYAVNVSANWRITFGWLAQDAIDVDLEDYH